MAALGYRSTAVTLPRSMRSCQGRSEQCLEDRRAAAAAAWHAPPAAPCHPLCDTQVTPCGPDPRMHSAQGPPPGGACCHGSAKHTPPRARRPVTSPGNVRPSQWPRIALRQRRSTERPAGLIVRHSFMAAWPDPHESHGDGPEIAKRRNIQPMARRELAKGRQWLIAPRQVPVLVIAGRSAHAAPAKRRYGLAHRSCAPPGGDNGQEQDREEPGEEEVASPGCACCRASALNCST